ncbi:MAG: hypothetical protein HGB00_07545 [Chlorobiaceae bacterium]|nr:hypothetical protein [Chlorobiaceae bacterium]
MAFRSAENILWHATIELTDISESEVTRKNHDDTLSSSQSDSKSILLIERGTFP